VKITYVIILGLGLAACHGSEPHRESASTYERPDVPADIRPEQASEWTMACQNGQSLVVTFDHPRQMATVRRSDGLAFDLMREASSTGYLFRATETELHGNGNAAVWRAPRVSDTSCRVTEVKPLAHP